MQSTQAGPRVAAVILAAGGSSRMGQPKQLLPVDGLPMVRRVAEAVCASHMAEVVAVTGADGEPVREALSGLAVRVLYNPDWEEGIGTSLRAGIGGLAPETEAALVVLADHPGLSPALIARLVECYRRTGAAIVAPTYRGQRGHPVLFDRSLFPDLLRLQGDQGARSLLEREGADLRLVEVDDPAAVEDVDTWESYSALGRRRNA